MTTSASRLRIPGLRWWIVGMLFLAAVLNYIDRSLLGLLAPTIQKDLGISDGQYAQIVNAFLIAYTIAYLLSGRVVDRVGSRLGMSLFIGWWSAANALTAAATSAATLGFYRFLLGLGEAGGFTASPKIVAEWFPATERALAVGIYSLGGSVGATIAPVLVIALAATWGWQGAFVATGILGLVWIIPWWWLAHRPHEHPRITDHERALVPPPVPASAPVDERALWLGVIRQPVVWWLLGARLMTDAVWYFYQFWLPKYLHDIRGVPQEGLTIIWVVFLAADIGFLSGGFLSGRLVRRGATPPAARLWIMLGCAALIPTSALIPLAPSVGWVLAGAMVVVLAHAAWLANMTSLVVDIVPKPILGTSFGLIAAGSAAGGILMNSLVAGQAKAGNYDPCFLVMAGAHPLALLLIWRLRRQPAQA